MESMVINGIIDLAGAFVCPYDAAAARLGCGGMGPRKLTAQLHLWKL